MKKLYAEAEGNTYLLLNDVEKEAEKAEMTLDEYIKETAEINPQFEKVYTA